MDDAIITLLHAREDLLRSHAAHNDCPHPCTRKENIQATPSTGAIDRAKALSDNTSHHIGAVGERDDNDIALVTLNVFQVADDDRCRRLEAVKRICKLRTFLG